MKIAGRIDTANKNINPGHKKLVIMLDQDETGKRSTAVNPAIPEEDISYPQMVVMVKRLNKFAKEQFGSKSALIEKLEITAEDAIKYFSYKKPLGVELLAKCAELGCDINWLLTGKGEPENNSEKMINNSVDKLNYEVYAGKLNNLNTDINIISSSLDNLNELVERIDCQFNKKLDDYIEKLVSFTVNGIENQISEKIQVAMAEYFDEYKSRVSESVISIDDITGKIKEFIKSD